MSTTYGSGVGAPMCVAEGELVNPAGFICRSVDLNPEGLNTAASDLRTMAARVSVRTGTVAREWSGLEGPYRGPEQEQVYALMDPAETAADELASVLRQAAGHLDTFASEVAAVKPLLADLESRANAFRTEALAGYEVPERLSTTAYVVSPLVSATIDSFRGTKHVSWREHQPAIDRNVALLQEHADLMERLSTAQAQCAGDLNTLAGVDSDHVEESVVTAEILMSMPGPMPWGAPVDKDLNCGESVDQGFANFGTGMWDGARSLFGRDPETGEWSGANARQAWAGMGDFFGSTLVVVSTPAWMHAAGIGGEWMDDRRNMAATGWGQLIGWDHQAHLAGENGFHRWSDNAVATGTETVANIGTFFIPVAGWGGGAARVGTTGARAATATSRVTRVTGQIAGTIAEFILPGGSHLVRGGFRATGLVPGALRSGGVPGVSPVGLVNAATDTMPAPGVTRGADVPGASGTQAPTQPGPGGGQPGGSSQPGAGGLDAGGSGTTGRPDPGDVGGARGDGAGARADGTGARPDWPDAAPGGRPGTGSQADGGARPGGEAPRGVRGDEPSQAGRPDTNGSPAEGAGRADAPEGSQGGRADGAESTRDAGDRPVTREERVAAHESLSPERRGDPRHDPLHPEFDGTWRDANGNVETVNPDVPSSSGLTNSGRLIDPSEIPQPLRESVDMSPDRSGNQPLVVQDGVIHFRESVDLTFDRSNPAHSLAEHQRQVGLQERAIRQLTAEEWMQNRVQYESSGRVGSESAYRSEWVNARADSLLGEQPGLTRAEARALAENELAGRAALHGPDQVAGGNPNQFTGFGDARVNSSLGSQWGGRNGNAELLGGTLRRIIIQSGGYLHNFWAMCA